jgi:hypothetical protein
MPLIGWSKEWRIEDAAIASRSENFSAHLFDAKGARIGASHLRSYGLQTSLRTSSLCVDEQQDRDGR